MELAPNPSKGFVLLILLIFWSLPIFGCSVKGHFLPPASPENLEAEFTEDIFGRDGIFLTWNDTNGTDDVGFTVYRDGRELVNLDPFCLDLISGVPDCIPASTSYFDTDVSRGETHCYAVSSYYYDWLMDLIFEESDKCPEVCIDIPLQGFTGSQTSR